MHFELSHKGLLSFLKSLSYEPTLQEETGQIYIMLNINDVDVPVFFGTFPDSPLLQVLAYLPFELHKEGLADVARMLHLLNKQLDMPGFGMDEKDKLMFYRCILPCPKNQVDGDLLKMYLGALRLACETFMFVIGSVVSGNRKVDDLLNE